MNHYIYHIVHPNCWEMQKDKDFYVHDSLQAEGFIHASTEKQLDATIQRYYGNEDEVVVLTIDTELLLSEVKYELAPSVNEEFPHIFGVIDKHAVAEVTFRKLEKSN